MKKDTRFGITAEGEGLSWARASRTASAGPIARGTGQTLPARIPEPVTLALPTTDVLFHTELIPSADPEEIGAIAQNRLEEISPLDPEEMVFSYEILSQDAENSLVLELAAPIAAVEKLRLAASCPELRIERVDTRLSGFLRVLEQALQLPAEALHIVLTEEDGKLLLLLLRGKIPLFVRTLGSVQNASEAMITRAIRLCLLRQTSAPAQETPAREAVPTLLAVASGEFAALAARVAEQLSLPLQQISPEQLFPAEFGCALRSFEPGTANLFPVPWQLHRSDRAFRKHFFYGILAALSVWLILAAYLYLWPLLLSGRETALRAQAAANEPAEKAVNEVRERIRIIEHYSDRTFSPLEILREVSLVLPEGVTITAFRFDTVRREASIEASASGSSLAYQFANAIKSSPLIADYKFASGPTEARSSRKTTFTLQLVFATPEEVAAQQSAQQQGGDE